MYAAFGTEVRCPILTNVPLFHDLLFDGLWSPAIAWVFVQFILIGCWSWTRSRTHARVVWGGFAALPLLLVLSAAVVTDRERIVLLFEQLAEAVETRDVGAIARHLDEDFSVNRLDRQGFIEEVERLLARYKIWDAKLRRFEIRFPGPDRAEASFHATARVRSEELLYDWFAARWKSKLVRRGDVWLVTSIVRSRGSAGGPLQLGDLAE